MGPLVRMVCVECLRSIEVSASGSTGEPVNCPHCGSDLDPFQAGIQSRGGLDLASPPTVDLSEASTLRSDSPLVTANRVVGRFQIRFALGEGGYGQVFQAYDPHLDREVALKVLKPNRLGEKSLERFYREARAAARLDHPNIVALHDAGRDEGRCWIAYQLVSGRTLSAIRDLARPSVLDSVRIVRDLALALHHAHGRGVFHRDLKPANVMIDDAGRPRLTDFGLARRDDVASDLTTEGTVLGTPQYMSPEAAAGRAREADGRSDVYSLGVILYELLCGRRPSDAPSGSPIWRSTHYISPATPRSVDRAIPIALDRICMKALALDPNDRYANAELLADSLTEQWQNYRPSRPRKLVGKFFRLASSRFLRAGGLAIASTLSLLAVASVLLLVRPPPAAVGPEPIPATSLDAAPSQPAPVLIEPTTASPSLAGPSLTPPESGDNIAPDGQKPRSEPTSAVVPAATSAAFIGNTETKKYHVQTCPYLPKPHNQVTFADRNDAIAHGYNRCDRCRHHLKAAPVGSPPP